MKRMGLLHRIVPAAVFAAWSVCASAIDFSTSAPPLMVTDQQLAVGSRTLMLPPGNWNYVAHSEGAIKSGHVDRKAPHHTAYAMDVGNGRMKGAVMLRLPVNSAPVRVWDEEPCKVQGFIHKDEFSGNFNQPECLLVYKRASHLRSRPSNEFYAQAYDWAVSQGVKMPGPVYEVVYYRFASNDFGILRVFVPLQAVPNDEAMIAWARQLQPTLQAMFENRQSLATLPALPAQNKN